MNPRLEEAIGRLRAVRNSQEDAIPELLEWAAAHIEALSDRVKLLEPVKIVGGELIIDATEEERKHE